MNEKRWYASKTLWGVIIMVLGNLLSIFKIDLGLTGAAGTALVDQIVNFISTAAEFVGALLAIFGRFKASTKLTVGAPKPPEPPVNQ